MLIVGISGSPRRGGNTERLLDAALEGAASAGADTRKVILNELNFRPCQSCGGCDKTGVCVLKDDMDGIYGLVESADAVIVGSPVYFGNVSAQLKMMIDRFQCAWAATYRAGIRRRARGRLGAFICVSGSDNEDFFNNAKAVVRNFLTTAGIKAVDELYCSGLDGKEDVLKDKKALEKAKDMGRGIALR